MAAGFSMDLSGIPQLKAAIEGIEKQATQGLSDELAAGVLAIQKSAKRKAPKNLGTLAQSISFSGSGLTWETFSTVDYAPYVEFGTGGKVSIPSGYEQFAGQYKGRKGGTMKEFIKAIALWVKRKGITGTYSVKTKKRTGSKRSRESEDMAAAWAIAIAILRNGIRAQPFMIPSYEEERPKLMKRLKERFK